jgi:anthranilate synthase/aminodeoxychorismate synthase-like glutamine amidotransferase
MLCVLIDHNDSFTYNLKAYLNSYNIKVIIITYNDLSKVKLKKFDFIMLSAGPGNPKNYPNTYKFIKKYLYNKPIFGVCLGMQIILSSIFKHKLIKIKEPCHGKISNIEISEKNSILFKNIKKLKVARYHSLGFKYKKLPFIIAKYDNYIMAIEDRKLKIAGTQYHIESFLTKKKNIFIKNLINFVINYE